PSVAHKEVYNAFQFHYGAIKGETLLFVLLINSLFQFHYGAIKGSPNVCVTLLFFNFNSTMVRLKESFYKAVNRGDNIFQFHYGAIKGPALVIAIFPRLISIPLWCD